jgi:hypothetical protein
LAIAFCCFFLIGCGAPRNAVLADFKERQKYLFQEMDRKAVYESCQQLMRAKRAGKLSATTYYCDDPAAKRNALPELIRRLEPTTLLVQPTVVMMSFASQDGRQSLMCTSNEFGEPAPNGDSTKGLGFRLNPFGMDGIKGVGFRLDWSGVDRLSGNETLDYLNATYRQFQMNLIPGLMYATSGGRSPYSYSLEGEKRLAREMELLFDEMQKAASQPQKP